ncbi:MAG: DUF4037 domain-containing protein [Anaerolineae bacterium]
MTPEFIPGLTLAELFYSQAARPILEQYYPGLSYAAALIGWGSEVLGYDDVQSRDHHWGPRFLLLLSEQDSPCAADIATILSAHLPTRFRGYSTHYGPPDSVGVRLAVDVESGPVNHLIHIEPLRSFLDWYLGVNPLQELQPADWLALSEQKLLTVTAGRVFADTLGELTRVRSKLAYYPRNIWLYLLAAEWHKIAQEEHLVGRAGYAGDELGAQLIAARLVHALMRLCFLMERRYPPYPKWFGRAFAETEAAKELSPFLRQALLSSAWREREAHLSHAFEFVAAWHNALALTPPLDAHVAPFYTRPYRVINGDAFAEALRQAIDDPAVAALPLTGSIDQFSDSTDLRSNAALSNRLKGLWR